VHVTEDGAACEVEERGEDDEDVVEDEDDEEGDEDAGEEDVGMDEEENVGDISASVANDVV